MAAALTPAMESLANGLAGAIGAAVGCYVVAPLGLIVQMKTSAAKASRADANLPPVDLSALGILRARIRSDGPLGLWRGELS